jgi:hypothetical protein
MMTAREGLSHHTHLTDEKDYLTWEQGTGEEK